MNSDEISQANLKRENAGDVIYKHIREAIESGQLAPGQVIASVRTLKESFNVSLHAVVTGLRRLEREGWIISRRGSGNYVRSADGRVGQSVTGKNIGLVRNAYSPLHSSLFLAPLLAAIRRELAARDYSADEEFTPVDNLELPRKVLKKDALIWVFNQAPRVVKLPATPPLVLVAQDIESVDIEEGPHDIVTADSRQGGMLVGKYLREVGCKRVAFVGVRNANGPGYDLISQGRLDGFLSGWGKEMSSDNFIFVDNYSPVSGLQLGAELVRPPLRFDGVFTAADDLAMGISHCAIAHGVKFGKDLRVVGFDGQPPRYEDDPVLTTAAISMDQLGAFAVRFALERAEFPDLPPRRLQIGLHLVRGETG